MRSPLGNPPSMRLSKPSTPVAALSSPGSSGALEVDAKLHVGQPNGTSGSKIKLIPCLSSIGSEHKETANLQCQTGARPLSREDRSLPPVSLVQFAPIQTCLALLTLVTGSPLPTRMFTTTSSCSLSGFTSR